MCPLLLNTRFRLLAFIQRPIKDFMAQTGTTTSNPTKKSSKPTKNTPPKRTTQYISPSLALDARSMSGVRVCGLLVFFVCVCVDVPPWLAWRLLFQRQQQHSTWNCMIFCFILEFECDEID